MSNQPHEPDEQPLPESQGLSGCRLASLIILAIIIIAIGICLVAIVGTG